MSAGDTVVVGFHSGDGFPESSAILKRLQEPTIHTERGALKVDGLKEDGKRLVASVNVPVSGHVIVTAVNGAAVEDMKPAHSRSTSKRRVWAYHPGAGPAR